VAPIWGFRARNGVEAVGNVVRSSPDDATSPPGSSKSSERDRTRSRIVLVAHDVHDQGGMEHAYAELVRALHSEFDLTVVSATLADELLPLVARWHRIRVPRRPIFAKFLVFFVAAGRALHRDCPESNLIHTLGAIVPNRVDIASLHFCHAGFRSATGSLARPEAPLLRRVNTAASHRLGLWAERWCYRPQRIRVLAAVSDGVRQEAMRYFPGVEVVLTPNGVDTARFSPDEVLRHRTRQAAQVGEDTCVALFVGGWWDHKGLGMAVEGLAMTRAAGIDVVLWVVGTGDTPRFTAMARELGVEQYVRFLGRRDDVDSIYRGADLFILPSAYEAFSLACLEAAASGLPLVIPPISGSRELVGDDEGGVIIERDASSVGRALRSLARDPAQRIHLGNEARRRAERFTWAASTAEVAKLYRSLGQAPGRRSPQVPGPARQPGRDDLTTRSTSKSAGRYR
jgi:glycosyltransferase involved in cell wall biosynthesis